MFNYSNGIPVSWLAFELNVLRRVKFKSVILPSGNDSQLGAALKRWNVCVSTNDFLKSGWIKSVAQIENNTERISDDEINALLHNVYVPRHRLQNQFLRNWFNETDAWWFDNLRAQIELLPSTLTKAAAHKIALDAGDYALSFSEENAELRVSKALVR